MDYQDFLNYIKENIAEYMEEYEQWLCEHEMSEPQNQEKEDYIVTLQQITKNNGIVLDGITIRRPDDNISPSVYLNSYFEQYQMGKPISVIMEELVRHYHKLQTENHIAYFDMSDFDKIRTQIVIRMVNYDRNKEMLGRCPHIRFLDLAITFRVVATKDSFGTASTLVETKEFERWNMEIDELYEIARINTMTEFPWRMESLASVVLNSLKSKLQEEGRLDLEREIDMLEDTENGVNMFVLTNSIGSYGATCMLYDGVIQNFAKVQESNIYVLPSSVHEVLLVPESEDIEAEFLQKLVIDSNESAVGLIDLLSDHIYYYNRELDEFIIWPFERGLKLEID